MKAVSSLLFCLVLVCAFKVLEAQKYCGYGVRYQRYCYSWWWGWRYCYYVPSYYCKFNLNPTSRPVGTLRMGQEMWEDDIVSARPEVWYSNRWGTICSLQQYSWDSNDAEFVCQQLGFGGQSRSGAVSEYPEIDAGTGDVWLDYMYCSGYYDWITQCYGNGWGAVSACTHDVDVAVSCNKQGIVRLDNGPTPFEGRLKVYHSGSWRKVCDDYWDNIDTDVVCRQLGFGARVDYITGSSVGTIYGRDYSSLFWLDNLHCTGDEDGLQWCSRNSWGSEDCYYAEEVAVNCSIPAPATTVVVKSSSQIDVTVGLEYQLRFSVTLDGYKIDYKEITDDTYRVDMVTTNELSYTYSVTGLKPYTQYDVKASAMFEEAAHKDSFSTAIRVRTKEAPPGILSGVWFQVTGSTTIRVYWTGLAEPNGVITRYSFRYWAKDPTWDNHNGVQFQEDENAKEYILTGLEPYTTYAINVRAVNSAGEGENTRLVAQTWQAPPSGTPLSVQAAATDTNEVKLQWSPPTASSQNGIITGYTIRWRKDWEAYKEFSVSNVGVYHFDNLQPYTVYRFRVAAKTNAGQGPFNGWVSTRTFTAAPTSPPQGVAMVTLSSEQTKVTWSQPASSGRNGIINKYTLHYGDDKSVYKSMDLQPTQLSFTITDAEAFTIYYARVAAWTSAGMGPFSGWVQSRTQVSAPTLPAAEVDVPQAFIKSNTAKATWSLPHEDAHNGVISRSICRVYHHDRGYQVGYYNPDVLDSTATQEAQFNTNLKPYTQYDVRVAVRNWYAIGPYSDPVTFRTLGDVPLIGPPILQLTPDPNSPSVTIRWRHVWQFQYNDESLTGYRITYQPTDNSLPAMTMDVPYSTTATVTGLNEATSYYFRMQAINSVGPGPYSDEMTVVTSGQAPDDAPQNVRVWALTSTSIHVQWDPPPTEDHELNITDYMIKYNEVADTNIVTVTAPAVTADDRHMIDITGLDEYRDYIVVIHAHNSQGGSPGSLPYSVRTLSAAPSVSPMISTLLENATEVSIEWNPISDMEATGVVTGYTILYGPTGRPQDTLHLAGDVYTHDFYHLDPHTEYSFRMAVTNQNGTGVFSSPQMITTDEDIPSQPREFRASAISPTAVTLTWGIPSRPNGELSYVVNYTALHSSIRDSEQFELANSLQISYNVTDLQEDVEYEFFLWAKTSIGLSDPVITQERTFEAVPIATPENVTATVVDSTSVLVTWVPPPVIFHNGEIVGYSINYWEDTGSTAFPEEYMMMSVDDPDARSYTLTGLTPYKTYSISVAIVNPAGPGPYSLEVQALTMSAAPPTPTGLRVTMRVNDSIYVTWDQPEHANGELLGYRFSWFSVYPDGINDMGNVTLSVGDTMFEMSGLYRGVEYRCRMYMYNDYGDSLYPAQLDTKVLPALPSDVPSVQAIPMSSTAIKLSWAPPSIMTWNGLVKGVMLKYIESGNPNATYSEMMLPLPVARPMPSDLTMAYNVTELDIFTVYAFMLAIVNEEGVGPYSEMVLAGTYEDLPGKCDQFEVLVVFNTINCSWTPPLMLNGELRGFHLYVNGELLDVTLTNLNYTYLLTNLKPRANYHVEVSAYTSVGDGEKSSVIVQTEDLPGTGEGQGVIVQVWVWIVVAAVVILVLVAALLVTVLGCVAYIRHKRARELKDAMGYAEDDDEWKLSANEHVPEKEDITATNPYSKEELARRAKEKEARLGTDVVGGLKGISDDDEAGFDSAINTLRGSV